MTQLPPAVAAHIEAFNARDAAAAVVMFADDAVFANADDIVVGKTAITALFRDAFAAPLRASLHVQNVVIAGDTVACELLELLDYAGQTFEVALAAFFTVADGELVRVRIYRDAAPG